MSLFVSLSRRLITAGVAVAVATASFAAAPTATAEPADKAPIVEPAPPGAPARGPAALPDSVARAEIGANSVVCEGDGVAGKRVELLYVREPGQPDRYDRYLLSFRAWASAMDDLFNDSAARTGASRHLRFVTQAVAGGCQVVIRDVEFAPGTFAAGWGAMLDALRAQGYGRTDRKYLFFTENSPGCGGAQGDDDDRPGPENRFNSGPFYAEILAPCWGSNAAAHELVHLMGGVLPGAPNAAPPGHCTDEWDLLCYGDPIKGFACAEKDADRLLDCGGQDYFNTNPPAGSWLATHWNVANSDFLVKGSVPDNDDGHLRGGWTYAITNAATGQAFDLANGSTAPLNELSLRPRDTAAASQKWVLNYETGWQLANAHSQLCADTAYSQTDPGTPVIQYRCNGQDGMRWAFQPLANGRFAIFNYLSGLAVTDSGPHPAPLRQENHTGAATQEWIVTRLADTPPANNAVFYLTSVDNAENAEVPNTTAGTDVVHNPAHTGTSQRWKLEARTGGYWRIRNVASNLCLRTEIDNTTPGTRLEQWTCDSGTRQQWTLRRHADTRYGLVNRSSGLAMSLTDGAGSSLEQWPYLGGQSPRLVWALRPV